MMLIKQNSISNEFHILDITRFGIKGYQGEFIAVSSVDVVNK